MVATHCYPFVNPYREGRGNWYYLTWQGTNGNLLLGILTYSHCILVAAISIERYILVVRYNEAKTLLSRPRRITFYVIVVSATVLFTIARLLWDMRAVICVTFSINMS